MKVKLKFHVCGPNGSFAPGSIIEDNGDLVEGGYAEKIEEDTTEIKSVVKNEEIPKTVVKKTPNVSKSKNSNKKI